MILRLTKEFYFQMAHALSDYDGKCRNLHGHNYKLLVTIEGQPSEKDHDAKKGMVIDFGDIKKIVNEQVINLLDHTLMLPQNSPFTNIEGTKKLIVPFQPTCENILVYIAERLHGAFPQGVRLHALRLYETATSYAELAL